MDNAKGNQKHASGKLSTEEKYENRMTCTKRKVLFLNILLCSCLAIAGEKERVRGFFFQKKKSVPSWQLGSNSAVSCFVKEGRYALHISAPESPYKEYAQLPAQSPLFIAMIVITSPFNNATHVSFSKKPQRHSEALSDVLFIRLLLTGKNAYRSLIGWTHFEFLVKDLEKLDIVDWHGMIVKREKSSP